MARVDLRENEYLERFVGQDHVDSNDVQFWYQLLSCSFNFMRVQDPGIVEKTLDPYITRLTLNNKQSMNIGSLIRVFIDRVSKIKSQSGESTNAYYVFQSFNALYLIRSICKSYIENSSEDQLIKSCRAATNTTNKSVTSDTIKKIDETTTPTSPVVSDSPNKKSEETPGSVMIDQFISTLIAIIVDIPLTDSTYLLQVESINALLVLLSVQMYSNTPAIQSVIYRSLMCKKCSIHALKLTKTLLNNFVLQQPVPQEAGSIIIGLASGLWKVLTLGYGSQEEDDSEGMPLLAKQSLLLLNILTNHHTTERNPYREALVSCQDTRFSLSDPQLAIDNANNDALVTATTSRSALVSNSIKIDFHNLYETICRYLNDDQVALLLYLLLHSNKIFRPYILTTTSKELDRLLLPLLKILYASIEKGSHHVYMVLIIFIILSEETTFNEAIHKTTIRGVPWYKDRVLNEISLGSLTALIIIRSFQYNTFRIKDKFLHTNLFATLANLSNHFDKLHPYVCQRLVDFLDRLTKRYMLATNKPANNNYHLTNHHATLDVLNVNNPLAKALATDTHKQDLQDASSFELDSTAAELHNNVNTANSPTVRPHNGSSVVNINIPEQQVTTQITDGSNYNNNTILPPVDMHGREYQMNESNGQASPNSNSNTDQVNISMDDARQDITLIEEVIRMILEVINNSLAVQLKSNPDLIYTLLYKRDVFSSLLSSHQSFYNMVINVERILTFFYNRIESFERQLSVVEIKELIQSTSKDWNFDHNIDPNARLLFHYVEDEQPDEFFIPYIWTRIYYSSGIAWNSKRIVLFNPDDL